MTYNEKNLARDCANKAKRAKLKNADEATYKAVWESIIKWIEYQFQMKKGISIGNFLLLGYKREEQRLQGDIWKPCFYLFDSFIRSFAVSQSGAGLSAARKDLGSVEDINFAKVAIRFSENLNKDTVFTCTRHLINQIGDAISVGQEVKIDFGVGYLKAKDRKVDFCFDRSQVRQRDVEQESEPLSDSDEALSPQDVVNNEEGGIGSAVTEEERSSSQAGSLHGYSKEKKDHRRRKQRRHKANVLKSSTMEFLGPESKLAGQTRLGGKKMTNFGTANSAVTLAEDRATKDKVRKARALKQEDKSILANKLRNDSTAQKTLEDKKRREKDVQQYLFKQIAQKEAKKSLKDKVSFEESIKIMPQDGEKHCLSAEEERRKKMEYRMNLDFQMMEKSYLKQTALEKERTEELSVLADIEENLAISLQHDNMRKLAARRALNDGWSEQLKDKLESAKEETID